MKHDCSPCVRAGKKFQTNSFEAFGAHLLLEHPDFMRRKPEREKFWLRKLSPS